MPRPTAAANAASLPSSTRRALLKAGGALGTIAALAVPVTILPTTKASAAPSPAEAEMRAKWPEFLRLLRLLDAEKQRNRDIYSRYDDRVNLAVALRSFDQSHDWWRKIVSGSDIAAAFNAAANREELLTEPLDAIVDHACKVKVQTVEGLAFKAIMVAYITNNYAGLVQEDPDDFAAEFMRDFVREIETFPLEQPEVENV